MTAALGLGYDRKEVVRTMCRLTTLQSKSVYSHLKWSHSKLGWKASDGEGRSAKMIYDGTWFQTVCPGKSSQCCTWLYTQKANTRVVIRTDKHWDCLMFPRDLHDERIHVLTVLESCSYLVLTWILIWWSDHKWTALSTLVHTNASPHESQLTTWDPISPPHSICE